MKQEIQVNPQKESLVQKESFNKSLRVLQENTQAFLAQKRQAYVQLLDQKLRKFELELTEYFFNYINSTLNKEVQDFALIADADSRQRSYVTLMDELQGKMESFKSLDRFLEDLHLCGRLVAVDSMQYLPAQPQMMLFMQTTKSEVDHQAKVSKKICKKTPCPVCQKALNSPYQVRQHIRTSHQMDQYLFCPHCQFGSGSGLLLSYHLFFVHSSVVDVAGLKKRQKQYDCVYTGLSFLKRCDLALHISKEVRYLKYQHIIINQLGEKSINVTNSQEKE